MNITPSTFAVEGRHDAAVVDCSRGGADIAHVANFGDSLDHQVGGVEIVGEIEPHGVAVPCADESRQASPSAEAQPARARRQITISNSFQQATKLSAMAGGTGGEMSVLR